MSQQKPPLIIKISWSLSTAIFDCGIYCNRQIHIFNVNRINLKLVKFHSSTSMQTLHSTTCSAIELLA